MIQRGSSLIATIQRCGDVAIFRRCRYQTPEMARIKPNASIAWTSQRTCAHAPSGSTLGWRRCVNTLTQKTHGIQPAWLFFLSVLIYSSYYFQRSKSRSLQTHVSITRRPLLHWRWSVPPILYCM